MRCRGGRGVRTAAEVRLARPDIGVVPASLPYFLSIDVGYIERKFDSIPNPDVMLRLSSFCSGSSFVPTGDLHRSGAVVYCADGRKKHPNTYRSGMAGGGNACLLVCHANRKALSSCTPAFFTLQIPDDMIRQFPTYKGCPSVRPCLPDAACTAATLHAGQLPDIPIVAGKPETP